ncbi:MAG: hypothetical protein ACLGJC_31310, partial [Alphaproteobacteria bacterium]
ALAKPFVDEQQQFVLLAREHGCLPAVARLKMEQKLNVAPCSSLVPTARQAPHRLLLELEWNIRNAVKQFSG